jgi:hypothetical protein
MQEDQISHFHELCVYTFLASQKSLARNNNPSNSSKAESMPRTFKKYILVIQDCHNKYPNLSGLSNRNLLYHHSGI